MMGQANENIFEIAWFPTEGGIWLPLLGIVPMARP
jgi:hypothetical protein